MFSFQWQDYVQVGNDTIKYYGSKSDKESNGSETALLLIHGAGSSSETFTLFLSSLLEKTPNLCITCIDLPNHGGSFAKDSLQQDEIAKIDCRIGKKVHYALNSLSEATDSKNYQYENAITSESHSKQGLSIGRLCNCLVQVIREILSKYYGPCKSADVFLLGHSLGGSIVCHIANLIPEVRGIIIEDVVQEYALNPTRLVEIINKRPKSFASIDAAIEWILKSKILNNRKSAQISIPPLLHKTDKAFVWKQDLHGIHNYCTDWFRGLSDKFLNVTATKLLVLPSTERLDKLMTIAQMQGRYQLQIFANVGHFIHEDEPEKFADMVILK